MQVTLQCAQCGNDFRVRKSRETKARFCNIECKGKWQTANLQGRDNPHWKGGDLAMTKECQQCGVTFSKGTLPLTTWQKRKFCSKSCADVGGFRFSGESHSRWTGGRSKRDGKHGLWAERVITRDGAKCRTCGAHGVELHAHHVLGWKEHPELRYRVSNGLTLCAPCHWAIHSASNENAVNSGNPQHDLGGGNPEPSIQRKLVEGVTTRGRAYRRIEGNCGQCGEFLSRRASDAIGKAGMFCNRSCSMKFTQAKLRKARAQGGNASKSAARESDDIV